MPSNTCLVFYLYLSVQKQKCEKRQRSCIWELDFLVNSLVERQHAASQSCHHTEDVRFSSSMPVQSRRLYSEELGSSICLDLVPAHNTTKTTLQI